MSFVFRVREKPAYLSGGQKHSEPIIVIRRFKGALVGPSYKRDVAVLQKKGVISYLKQVWLSGESINPGSPTLFCGRILRESGALSLEKSSAAGSLIAVMWW